VLKRPRYAVEEYPAVRDLFAAQVEFSRLTVEVKLER
jgi:hypothetical protein